MDVFNSDVFTFAMFSSTVMQWRLQTLKLCRHTAPTLQLMCCNWRSCLLILKQEVKVRLSLLSSKYFRPAIPQCKPWVNVAHRRSNVNSQNILARATETIHQTRNRIVVLKMECGVIYHRAVVWSHFLQKNNSKYWSLHGNLKDHKFIY